MAKRKRPTPAGSALGSALGRIRTEPPPGMLPKPGPTAHARARTISHSTPASEWFGTGAHPIESASTKKRST